MGAECDLEKYMLDVFSKNPIRCIFPRPVVYYET